MDCQNCLHYDACTNGILNSIAPIDPGKLSSESCPAFKNKDLILLLPCKIGETYYSIVKKTLSSGKTVYSFIKKSRLTFNNLERVIKAFGKTAFLSKIEAEEAFSKLNDIGIT